MNVCIVGTGYVGLVTGTCFADFGVNVCCVDKDEDKIAMLRRGEIPIYEPGLKELVEKNSAAGRLSFTTDMAKAVRESLVIFIAVGTPYKPGGEADLSYVEEVARSIGCHMNGYKVVVTKSTVPAGTGRMLRRIIEESQPGEKYPFDMVSNPEFLREGSAIEDFMRPNRVVIGTESEQAAAIMRDLYKPLYLIETPIVMTTVESAEMIKYASNAFLATKISFINEVANLCEKVGADVHAVAKGMGLDRRIGPKFLHPGPGYGGSCFPKDTEAFVRLADKHGVSLDLVRTTIEVNRRQREVAFSKIVSMCGGDVSGVRVAIAGLSFKPNTDDMREAPSIDIIRMLVDAGARVVAYDPVAMENARKVLPPIEYAANEYELAEGADVLVIMTEWNCFRMMDLERISASMRKAVLVDLRNVFEPEDARRYGFEYTGMGRG